MMRLLKTAMINKVVICQDCRDCRDCHDIALIGNNSTNQTPATIKVGDYNKFYTHQQDSQLVFIFKVDTF